MLGHLRVKSPWSQLAIFLGLMGLALVIISVLGAIAMITTGAISDTSGKPDWTNPGFVSTMKVFQSISSIILFFIPAAVFAWIVHPSGPFDLLGMTKKSIVNIYLLAVVCMLASFPVVSWLGEINQRIPLPQWMIDFEKDTSKQMVAFLTAKNFLGILINLIVLALIPAICEEICFRGALQRIIINLTKNPWTGIIVTAILFSALHMQFLGFLPRMYLGVVLGAIYWYSGSLWPSTVAHFVYNGVQVVGVAYAPEYIDKNPSLPLYSTIISAAVILLVMRAIRSHSTTSYDEVYQTNEPEYGNQSRAQP